MKYATLELPLGDCVEVYGVRWPNDGRLLGYAIKHAGIWTALVVTDSRGRGTRFCKRYDGRSKAKAIRAVSDEWSPPAEKGKE